MNTTLSDPTVNSLLAVLATSYSCPVTNEKIVDMLLDTYPYNSILTSESLLCIAFKATAQHIHEFWEITFVVRQAPNYSTFMLPYDNLLFIDQPSVNEAYQISTTTDSNYNPEYMDYLAIYNEKGPMLTLMRTLQFHYNDSFIVFRPSFLTQNCRSGDPTFKYGSPNNDTIRTDANTNDMNKNGVLIFCHYYWAMDKNSPNGVNLFYRKINYFKFESSSENAINVATVTMKDDKSQVYKDLFQIDQNSYKEWKNVIIFGPMITFDIPILSTFTINGDIYEGSDFVVEVSDIEKTSGILMSPFYPGMQFVASKSVIHRDLAARNVLLTNTNVAKITDFGLCCKSDEESQTYQASIHKPLPMRWLPIEALADRIFSEKSDVWSFGILTYEIFSRGKVPYETMDHNQMYEFLKNGQRLDCPEDAPNQIYAIMMSCWEKEPGDRPSFGDLQ
uniref:Protein kinase domain-containing protein n=1 Tax=Acrobeloides nanus TaxID=290746 RepID=A0A914EGK0_9BILA